MVEGKKKKKPLTKFLLIQVFIVYNVSDAGDQGYQGWVSTPLVGKQ